MATDQSVQLNPGAGGSRVRTLEVTLVQGDGTLATVEMQVVAIADPQGHPLNFDFDRALERVVDKLEEIRLLLELNS